MDYNKLADVILPGVGGEKNIAGFTHCATRLRFTLKDESLADEATLKKTKGVLGIAKSGGQFQIIIGNEVPHVFKAVQSKMTGQPSGGESPVKAKRKVSEAIFDFVSSIFAPILPAIIGAGLVKSVLALAVLLGMNDQSTTYYFINLIGDAPLYFLPVLLAYTASKKIGCNQALSVAVAGAMLHPNYAALITDAFSINFSSFLGIPVTLATYSSSVIPVLLMVFAMKYVEAFCEKFIPKMFRFFLKPLVCLLVVAPLTFIALGPIGFVVGFGISSGLDFLNNNVGFLAPTLLGALFPLMVTTGMHYGLVPFMTMSLASNGFESFSGPAGLPSNISQGAASLAVAVRTKNSELKQTAFTTGATALLGITEPALFAVTLKFRKVLPCVMIGGAIGGLYAGIMGVQCYSFCSPGLLSLVAYVGPNGWGNITNAVISMLIAFVATFLLVFFYGFEEVPTEPEEPAAAPDKTPVAVTGGKKDTVVCPAEGEVVPLSEVPDPTFAEEILGKGVAVKLMVGKIYSPINGTVDNVPDSKHAIGLTSDDGVEILIHVGLDTVSLNGQYFDVKVKEGQRVKKGDLLLICDKAKIEAAGYPTITPVIVTNGDDFTDITPVKLGPAKPGDAILNVQ